MSETAENRTTALANWFGANRTLAATVGQHLADLTWVGVPFAGGCCELPHIKCRSGIAADKHRHLINLARVVRDEAMKVELVSRLDGALYHPDELASSQSRLRMLEEVSDRNPGLFSAEKISADEPSVGWAYDYFVASWMGRGGKMGTDGEFKQGLSYRWNANGGDSCRRFRSAVESLEWWCQVFRRWNFIVMDWAEFLKLVMDVQGHGVYCDPPWVGAGEAYVHKFTTADHCRLAEALSAFRKTKVVVRYGDDPLIRKLYSAGHWTIIEQTSRNQADGDVAELLIVNRREAA